MDEPRPVSDPFLLRVKAATRDLVKFCGGVVRAGEITSRSKTEVSRWQSPHHPDLIDIASAIVLEAECNLALVTTVMAEIHGRRLSDEVEARSAASVLERYSDLMRVSAETAAQMSQALSDLTITPTEAETLDRGLSEQAHTIHALRATLATVRAQGPASATAPLRVVKEG